MRSEEKRQNTAGSGIQGRLQDALKRYGSLYRFLVSWFGPVHGGATKRSLKAFSSHLEPGMQVLNVGSGPYQFKEWPAALNVDMFAFNGVAVIADAVKLPFQDGSIDAVICVALLEHVEKPDAVIAEIKRVLKEQGRCLCYLPFMVPYHAAPGDFHRWTEAGARAAFEGFSDVVVSVGAGPTSALLWVWQEWAATMFSFGNRPLHDILLLLLMVSTWPFKLIDIALERLPLSCSAASGFVVQASIERKQE